MEPGEGTSTSQSPVGSTDRLQEEHTWGVCERQVPSPTQKVYTGGARTLLLNQGPAALQGTLGNAQCHVLSHLEEGRLVVVLPLMSQGQRCC